MKRLGLFIVSLFFVGMLAGCAASPYQGMIYSDVILNSYHLQPPMDAQSAQKSGTSSCSCILGLIAVGDASVGAAMQQGGIKKCHHVDYSHMNFLGFFAQHTTTVYGE